MGKNHSTNKERSHTARRKHRLRKLKESRNKKRLRIFKNAIRAYFKGEGNLLAVFFSDVK